MIKIAYYILKTISVILLIPVVFVAIPGATLYFICEEIEIIFINKMIYGKNENKEVTRF